MYVFLRVISLLIIFFASLSLAMGAGSGEQSDPEPRQFEYDFHIQRQPTPNAPLLSVSKRDVYSRSNKLVVLMRGDLDSKLSHELKFRVEDKGLESLIDKGVWFTEVRSVEHTRYDLHGFDTIIPGWIVERQATAHIRDHIKTTPEGIVRPGTIIASIDNDTTVYPRHLSSSWTVLELLRQHARQVQIHPYPDARFHPGSRICEDFLKQLDARLKSIKK